MAKASKEKSKNGASGEVSVKIDAGLYAKAKAQCGKLATEIEAKTGTRAIVRPSAVINRVLKASLG